MPYRDINLDDYANLISEQNKAKKYFRDAKMGNQLFEEANLKLFSPITTKLSDENQKNINQSKAIQEAVQHLDDRLQAIDQVAHLQHLPYHFEQPAAVTPLEKEPPPITTINFEKNLNDTDRKNLEEMGLPLPKTILSADDATKILGIVKTKNRSFGQYTRQDNKKTAESEKALYEQKKETLKKYKTIVETIAAGSEYVVTGQGKKPKLVKQKGKRGRPKINKTTVYYNSIDELFQHLDNYTSAKLAGHNDVDDIIVDILDELLNKKAISQDIYNQTFKKYFPDYIK